jgi:hypothetical protein
MPDDVPALPAAFLDELRARTPLPKMIGRSVRLERSGRQWKGNCPFHAERTPSFNVRDDHYHCFGCGAHGDAIEFVMQSQGASFMEAVERLAKEAGLEIPKSSPAAPAPTGAVTGMQGNLAPATTAPLRAPASVAEVLKLMERMHDAVADSDPRLADVMSYLIQRGADPDRRAQPRFQHNVAYTLQDLEKQTGLIALSSETRNEMTRLAGSAPGLENPRALALMSATASIQDGEVVREIRRVAGNIGLRADQSTHDIESRLAALEAKARLAVRTQPAPPSEAAAGPGRAAAQTPPRENGAIGANHSATAGGGVPNGGQPQQVPHPRPALDTLLSGLHLPGQSNGTPPPEQPAETPMAGRLAAFERRTQGERDGIALRGAVRSGHAALDALQAFGEGAAVMSHIREAARSDPGGLPAVLTEMRGGGRYAELRQRFNGALEADYSLFLAYDGAAAALARYGADRGTAQDILGRRPDAGAVTARLEQMDAAVAAAAAATPGRSDGRSMADELAGQAAGLLRRAVDAGKAPITGSPAAASSASQSISAG